MHHRTWENVLVCGNCTLKFGSNRTSSWQLALGAFRIKRFFVLFMQLLFKVEIIVKKIEKNLKVIILKRRRKKKRKRMRRS